VKKSLLLISSLIWLSFSCQSQAEKSEGETTLAKVKTQDQKVLPSESEKTEDCDDKAKKVIEIKEETLSLGGGDTGCSLEDL
jgi:hypothetical protein